MIGRIWAYFLYGKFKGYLPQVRNFVSLKAAGLKCRSQATGQVTGYRSQATGQVTGQVTGHRSQATGQVTGHPKNNRTLDKTVLD